MRDTIQVDAFFSGYYFVVYGSCLLCQFSVLRMMYSIIESCDNGGNYSNNTIFHGVRLLLCTRTALTKQRQYRVIEIASCVKSGPILRFSVVFLRRQPECLELVKGIVVLRRRLTSTFYVIALRRLSIVVVLRRRRRLASSSRRRLTLSSSSYVVVVVLRCRRLTLSSSFCVVDVVVLRCRRRRLTLSSSSSCVVVVLRRRRRHLASVHNRRRRHSSLTFIIVIILLPYDSRLWRASYTTLG